MQGLSLREIYNVFMPKSQTSEAMASEVWFDSSMMHVRLLDGREISVPIEWFPRLRNAAESQRTNWRLIGKGLGIHPRFPLLLLAKISKLSLSPL